MRTKIEFLLSLAIFTVLILLITSMDEMGGGWYVLTCVPVLMMFAIIDHSLKVQKRISRQNLELKKLVEAVQNLKEKYLLEIRNLTLDSRTSEANFNELYGIRKTLTRAAIWAVMDKNKKIAYVNRLYCEISGYKKSELIGNYHTISNDGLYEDEFWFSVLEQVRNGNAWRGEVKNKRKDGSIYWTDTLIGPIKGNDGEFESYLTLKFDITEKKNMEEELNQKNQELNLLNATVEEMNSYLASQQNAMEESMLILKSDLNCNITFANKHVLDLFGFSAAELISNCVIIDPAFEENPTQEQVKIQLEKGEIWKGELRSRNKAGEPVWLHLAIAPIFNQGEITSLLMIGFDATARKKMEDRIIRQKQELIKVNQSKDKLFGLVAHDLKSPLASLEGILELLAAGKLSKDEIQILSSKIRENLGKVNELLTDLLNWSMSQLNGIKVRPSKLNIRDMTIKTIDLLSDAAAKKDIIIENITTPNLNILSDDTMTKTVFRNLLANAIKFSNPGGTIQVSSVEKRGTNTVFISDNGVGIDYESQKRLFDDFTGSRTGTTGETGSGLGLQICKDFLEKNKGILGFESIPGKGSTFYFELPKFKVSRSKKMAPVAY